MAIDVGVPRSRRALLAGGICGMAGVAAAALGRPLAVRAADGQTVVVGGEYTASSVTKLDTSATGAIALMGKSGTGTAVRADSTSGYGVEGRSTSGHGVAGFSTSGHGVAGFSTMSSGVYGYGESGPGVHGWSDSLTAPGVGGRSDSSRTGVIGVSGLDELPTAPAKTGVYGYAAQDTEARGVHGKTTGGRGVYGEATTGRGVYGHATSGTALYGASDHGYALRTSGRLKADQVSGVATIPAGATSHTVVLGVNLTSVSFVLLTPRGNLRGRSLWYTVDTVNDVFHIKLSSALTTDIRIGWLLLG